MKLTVVSKLVNDLKIVITQEAYCPANQQEWRRWLQLYHEEKDAVWLIMYKKNSSKPNLSWSEAVDQALCFGWIDSVKKSIDDQKYKQYYSKRKPNSTWSRINKNKVETLIKQGLMTEAGIASITLAKNNGSWTILDQVESLVIPKDLEQEFDLNIDAKAYFERLSKSKRKGLLYWIVSAKRPSTRQNRILEIIKNACLEQMPKPFR